ncbi:hypothetical protein [Halosimplex sp. TS25]|uniref:hypothetical protein n=1 Tax=Halosimplex rarum TaxID=3396619 RepID=UPI0039E8121C
MKYDRSNTRLVRTASLRLRALLAGSFALFFAGLATAIRTPAVAYELSIYGATPVLFWAATGAAFLLGVAVALSASTDVWARRGAYLQLYLCALAVATIPLLRDYYFIGLGDPLSHLGWIRELGSGALDPVELRYPGGHTMAVLLHDVGGFPYRLAEQLIAAVFVATYLLAFPLLVVAVAGDRDTNEGFVFLVGLLTALLWLPINGISVHKAFHPFSMGVLFLPFVLYLLLSYVSAPWEGSSHTLVPTKVGALLAFASVAMTLIHPQAALVVVMILGTVSVVQFVVRRTRWRHRIADHRSVHGLTAFAGGVLLLWLTQFTVASRIFWSTVDRLMIGGAPGAEATQRGSSLQQVGGSIPELFAKLFLPSALFAVLVAAFLFSRWFLNADAAAERVRGFVDYMAVALASLGALFVVAFVANVTTQHFRYHGAAMLLVALIGAVALASFVPGRVERSSRSPHAVAVILLLVVLVPVSGMVLYSSPYIYQPSSHITEAQVDGYDTMLEHRDEGVAVTGVRQKYVRYIDSIRGRETTRRAEYEAPAGVPETVFNSNISTYYEDPRYLPVTQLDYEREVVLYEGFRYSAEGFRSLDTTPGINRVQSNGGFQQYHLPGDDEAA